jgi:hypothetical protein
MSCEKFIWDILLNTGEKLRSLFGYYYGTLYNANTNLKIAAIHLYEKRLLCYMMFLGIEFFDRSGSSLIRTGDTTGNRKEIRLQEDENVDGVKAITIQELEGILFDAKFIIVKVY